MVHHEVIGLAFARTVELVRSKPGARDEQKAALRCLVALTSLGSTVVKVSDGVLSVNGTGIDPSLPSVAALIAQMQAHAVAEVGVSQNASAQDLLTAVVALAGEAAGSTGSGSVESRMRTFGSTTVKVLAVRGEETIPGHRPPSVTAAFDAVSIQQAIEEAALKDTPLGAALGRLEKQPAGPDVLNRLSAVAEQVAALGQGGGIEVALRAIATVLWHEANAPETARASYSIVVKRMLPRDVIEKIARLAPDQRYAGDVVKVMQRLGGEGTEVLLGLLADAATTGDGRMYLNVLRELREGMHLAVEMLTHKQWFVARNVADLLGELRVIDAVPALAKALEHPEPRVGRSAAVALAKIGTPAAALHLRKTLKEGEAEVRGLVAGAIGGRESKALAMPLVMAADSEENPELVREYYKALGRIGSGDALQALAKAVQPGGRILSRKPSGPRLAAIEGLRIAGGPVAMKTLEGLAEDSDKEVREMARKALEELRRPSGDVKM